MDFSKPLIPFNAPRPDRKAKRWPRSWKDRHRKCGTRLKKPAQYNLVTIEVA